MSGPEAALRAEHVTKSYGGRTVIRDVSLRLEQGELVCLLGVSGAGKTTLFHSLSGLERPEEGRVLLFGEDVTGTPGKISYMLQRDLLLPHKKIPDNAALPLVIRGAKAREARERALSYFPQFGLEGTEDKYPAQLSGGMRQRAALLRTFLGARGVALLDEPFSALDALTKREIHRWYMEMMDQLRLTTLFITHDIDEAILLSDRVCVLSGRPGRIAAEIWVDPPRPRDLSFSLSGEFLAYKRQILALLEAYWSRTVPRAGCGPAFLLPGGQKDFRGNFERTLNFHRTGTIWLVNTGWKAV